MKIYQYKNYQQYVDLQTQANKLKIDKVWASVDTIKAIAKTHGAADSILCHGTRNGAELKFFRTIYPEAKILGTEISESATDFADTVQWDFHDTHPEWIGKFDIVYSNSFDHSFDPIKALDTWRQQLTTIGSLCIEYSFHFESRAWDPLEIKRDELLDLFNKCHLRLVTFFASGTKDHGSRSEVFVLKNAQT